jgi:hypothetical protein
MIDQIMEILLGKKSKMKKPYTNDIDSSEEENEISEGMLSGKEKMKKKAEMLSDEMEETPEDEAMESPQIQKKEKKMGVELHDDPEEDDYGDDEEDEEEVPEKGRLYGDKHKKTMSKIIIALGGKFGGPRERNKL